jgi:hypothetical protein
MKIIRVSMILGLLIASAATFSGCIIAIDGKGTHAKMIGEKGACCAMCEAHMADAPAAEDHSAH